MRSDEILVSWNRSIMVGRKQDNKGSYCRVGEGIRGGWLSGRNGASTAGKYWS